jgi:hypothetical protein
MIYKKEEMELSKRKKLCIFAPKEPKIIKGKSYASTKITAYYRFCDDNVQLVCGGV